MAKETDGIITVGGLNIRKPTSDEWALAGPIDQKPPAEKAKHRVYVMRSSWRRLDTSWEDWHRVIGDVIADRVWESYPEENPCGSLPELLRLLDINPDQALNRKNFSGRDGVMERAKNTETLAPSRGVRTESIDYDYNQLPRNGIGTSAEYLTARIARDHPAILEDMKQGKYKSVRAAAIDAGIVDPEKTRRFQLPTDPVAAGRYLAYRVDKEWLMECVDAFMKEEQA